MVSSMKLSSMMCVPPGCRAHSKIMIVPISVMPAVSPTLAPQADSSCRFTAGIEPAGSPDTITLSTLLSRARSMPIPVAACHIRKAYVGVEHTAVTPISTIVRTRPSVVADPDGRTRQPIFSQA
jgi:hypothetical protein